MIGRGLQGFGLLGHDHRTCFSENGALDFGWVLGVPSKH